MKCDNKDLYNIVCGLKGKLVSLYSLATWKNGLSFKNIDFSNYGKPVIKISELNNGISSSTAYTNQDYDRDVYLTKGDLLFSWSGNPDTSIDVFRYTLQEGWLNQHIFKVTENDKIILKDYLYYILKWLKPIFKEIARNKQTTGLGHITVADLKAIKIVVPDFAVQRKFIRVLKPIDDKIELNNAINNNLQQQAQACYVSMFIENADPTWKQGYLSDLITVKYGKDHKKLADGVYPVYGSGGIMRYVERPIYDKESVLIPRKGTLNNVMYINHPFWSVDTMFYTEMQMPNVAKFVYHFLKSKDLASMNAGSAVPSMTTDILNSMEVVVPAESALEEFEKLVAPMYRAMQENDNQSSTLVKLRDVLLSKLMSGELDVSEIDI